MLLNCVGHLMIRGFFCIRTMFKLEMGGNNTEEMVQYLEKSVSEVLGIGANNCRYTSLVVCNLRMVCLAKTKRYVFLIIRQRL